MAIDAGALNGALIGAFEAKTHRNLSFKALHPHLLSADPSIEVEQLVIGSPPAITAIRFRAPRRRDPCTCGSCRCCSRHLVLTEVALKDVDLHMVRLGHGHNNYSFGGAGLTGHAGAGSADGDDRRHIEYDDPQRSLTLIGSAEYDPADRKLPLHLTGRRRDPGRALSSDGARNAADPAGRQIALRLQAKLQDGATHAAVSGATQKPFDFRGFDLQVAADGPNLADFGYLFNFDSPNTPPYQLTTRISRKAHAVHLARSRRGSAGATSRATLISDHNQPRRRFTVDFTADTLRAEDLAVLASPRPDHAAARSKPGVAAPKCGQDAVLGQAARLSTVFARSMRP